MHLDNEFVEFIPTGEQEYEEIIEEYKEEILVQEGAPEPSVADFVDPICPRQAPVHNPYFEWSLNIYMISIYVTGILWKLHT